ncbi:ATP-binding cassette domain-containing protein [Asticcacaulis benevestitus]|uniref:ABC transporter ATP-binding protein n=1 Tax=Asticcacaulis benevestitus DSM 16100 = ATCC BAA-896 TaxID=1121022 RepID=V4NPP7_9CAUL|nr:ABC transporter ATP-binding protein [Asticcacaulis benevestitus]ESQ83772.1 hypothetical protein ABENE_20075 [Asticcacaulis benevestitus DSM 16100 = ATCC BAA-896]
MEGTDRSSDKPTGLAVVLALARQMVSRDARVRGDVVIGAGLELVGIGLGIGGPFALKLLVDGLYTGQIEAFPMMVYVGLFVLTWTGANVVGVWRMIYSTRVIDRLSQQLITAALESHLPEAARARDADRGQVGGQLERLPFSLMVVVDGLIWRAVPLLIQVLGSLWLLAGIIPLRYALIMAVVLAGYVGATWLGATRHQALAQTANAAISVLSRNFTDVLRNARRVVLNGAVALEIDRLEGQFADKRLANGRMMVGLLNMSLCQYGLVGGGVLLLLVLAGLDVLQHKMTVGDFVLLQAYAFRLASPLSGFGFILSQSAISIANIADVMCLCSEPERTAPVSAAKPGPAAISLRNVSFGYGPGLPGLQDINLDIPAGSFTVIVGPNGSGKSTLAQIISGLLEPSVGTVTVAGEDMALAPRSARHMRVLYVPQLTGLFARSMLSNALYPPTAQTEHGLADLLAQWNFYEAGRQVDLRLEVGEQGERLSGGQIQKLELARIAGIKVPAILLDESTSALDPASEEAVISTLRQTFGGQTTLVLITHRIRLAELADQVLFLKGGKLVRQGTHAALLTDSAAYASLWRSAGP